MKTIRDRCKGSGQFEKGGANIITTLFFFVWGKDCHPFIHYLPIPIQDLLTSLLYFSSHITPYDFNTIHLYCKLCILMGWMDGWMDEWVDGG